MVNMASPRFGELLRRARQAAGLTQEELAERAGLSRRGINDLERGVRLRPRKDTVALLAEALGLAGDELTAFESAARGHMHQAVGPPAIAGQPNLPIQPTPLLGREREIAEVVALLRRDDVRLVTLTGPGGVGKTRLAAQVAADLSERFADGALFVPLAQLADPNLVLPTIAQTLGLRESTGLSLEDGLRNYVRTRTLLLVLDNFEHVAAAAPQVAEMLASGPAITVLVTSRVGLRLRGEKEYPVPPLALPPLIEPDQQHDAHLLYAKLAEFAAVALFLQRAQDARPDFRLTGETAPAVAGICRRLDGLPLALELAAARVKVLPPLVLLQRLQRRLPLLTGGARDLPERQQTMRATLAWSEALLQSQDQRLFRRLAVFVGGWTLEAAETVCTTPVGAVPLETDVLDGLGRLADQSLVQQQAMGESGGEPRFTMLQVIREYALEGLEASDDIGAGASETVPLRRAHAAYFLGLAEQAEPELRGPVQTTWLDCIERDHDNLLAALSWLIEHDLAEEAVRLALALWPFWHSRTYLREGQRWLEQVLALADRSLLTPVLRARLMSALGVVAHTLGQFDRADAFHSEAIRLWREIGDIDGLANAVLNRGYWHFFQLDLQQARAFAEESLALAQQVGNQLAIADALNLRAGAAVMAVPIKRAADTFLADLEECLRIWREVGDTASVASALSMLAHGEINAGRLERAKPLLAEAVATNMKMGRIGSLGPTMDGLLRVAIYAKKQPEGAMRAAQLLGAIFAWGESHGTQITSLARATSEQISSVAKDVLGEEVFAHEYLTGQHLTLDAALALAMAVVQPGPDSGDGTPP
jgi:predicted ATPase/transcriptional regulator with XRE-family HTH domain